MCVARALDEALAAGIVDLVCGVPNRAQCRRPRAAAPAASYDEAVEGHESTLNIPKERRFLLVADYAQEWCFAAVHERHVAALNVAGSCCAHRQELMSEEDAKAFGQKFLQKVGARTPRRMSTGP